MQAIHKINECPDDFKDQRVEILEKVKPYTITSPINVQTLIESVRYVLRNNIKGAFVECGVFKGGSMMAIALALLAEGITDRELYLFDTFAGMPEPEPRDIDYTGEAAMDKFFKKKLSKESSTWTNASLEDVRKTMALTRYPSDKIHFVKGLVENTLPEESLNSIALLRLDTDWYKSTKHELTHLYPIVSSKGVVIVDDYGHWKGSKESVDEYFLENRITSSLHEIDHGARLSIKN